MKSHVIIHHSATKDGDALSWQAIRRAHVAKGWRDIAYNLGIERVNDQPEALLGRPLDWSGAHAGTRHWNRISIGVCIVGNFSQVAPDGLLLDFAARHVAGIMSLVNIPLANCLPHSAVRPQPTECPGAKFPWDAWIELLAHHMEED